MRNFRVDINVALLWFSDTSCSHPLQKQLILAHVFMFGLLSALGIKFRFDDLIQAWTMDISLQW